MFFFFTCGEQTFRSELKGYEGIVCQCHNCGNMSGRVIKSRPFFTFCFIPIIPYTLSGYKDVSCHICNFHQPLDRRPDVTAMANGQGGGGQYQHGPPAQQGGQYKQGAPPQQGGYYQQGPPQPQGGPSQQRWG